MIIYSTKQLADILSVSPTTIKNWRNKGLIDCKKIGHDLIYFVSDEKINELKKG